MLLAEQSQLVYWWCATTTPPSAPLFGELYELRVTSLQAATSVNSGASLGTNGRDFKVESLNGKRRFCFEARVTLERVSVKLFMQLIDEMRMVPSYYMYRYTITVFTMRTWFSSISQRIYSCICPQWLLRVWKACLTILKPVQLYLRSRKVLLIMKNGRERFVEYFISSQREKAIVRIAR